MRSAGKTAAGDVVEIDTTASGSAINFNTTGGNSIFGNGAGGIVILNADGDVTFTTPTTIIDPETGFLLTGISIFGLGASDGTISFADTVIQRPAAVGNTVVEINGHQGTVNFNNLAITFNGVGAVGLSAFNSGNLNNTIFSSIGGFTTDLTGSTVSGSGNIAVPFSSNNGGGNTGTILFNGGADSAP